MNACILLRPPIVAKLVKCIQTRVAFGRDKLPKPSGLRHVFIDFSREKIGRTGPIPKKGPNTASGVGSVSFSNPSSLPCVFRFLPPPG